ncbi:MAG: methyltransferase domain-containing protein [Candidatus Methanomethyliaceae archaeon]
MDLTLKDKVKGAYDELSKNLPNWAYKYDIGYQLYKMLCDYRLLGKIDLRNKRVLNIGCYEPIDETYWVHLVGEWHALDINERVIRTARRMVEEVLPSRLLSKLSFIVGDATALPIQSGSYDVVVAFSTIDHIPGREERAKAIREISRVLKQGGVFVITVPNRWDLYYSYRSNKAQREGKAPFGYEYQFSPLELRKMLIAEGFRIVDCASTSFNPHSYFDRFLRRLGLARLKIYFGTRFGYLAQKK